MNRRHAVILSLAILSAIAIGILGYQFKSVTDSGAMHDMHHTLASSSPVPVDPDFETLAAQVKKAVVNISGEREDTTESGMLSESLFSRMDGFNLFDSNFDTRWSNLGSGFILNPDGYILTNRHIVENASSLRVELNDRRVLGAVLVGTDPKTDLAVLKTSSAHLPSLPMAKSDTMAVGDWVAAFGSPSGAGDTITAGIICGKGRFPYSGSYNSLLQTDAVINSENSGGPLVNLQGEAIGVNVTIEDLSRRFNGLGFAIPASTAWQAFTRIIQTGRIARGWIGVSIQDITPPMASFFGLITRDGVLVSEVVSGSPAAKSGLKSGDIILEFNHQKIHTSNDLVDAVARTKAGTISSLKILRDGKLLSLNVPIGERPSAVSKHFPLIQTNEPETFGITVENITPETQAQMGLHFRNGVLVVDVDPGSIADIIGLLPGDVIRDINHTPVNSAGDLSSAIYNSVGRTVLLRLERNGNTFFVAFDFD